MRRGFSIEFLGGCLVLLASTYPALGWTPIREYSTAAPLGVRSPLPIAILGIGLCAMVWGYGVALRTLRHMERPHQLSLRVILLLSLGLSAPLLLLPSLPSTDLFSYALYGRIEAIHVGNPYTMPPGLFKQDPLVRLAGSSQLVSVYGPLWQRITAVIALSMGQQVNPLLIAAVYKVLALIILGLGATLVWMILGRIRPAQQAVGTWLYAANPICLLMLAGEGHNDGVMMALVLLAIYAHVRKKIVLAVLCLGLAILTKWIILLLIPAYLLWLWLSTDQRIPLMRDLAFGLILVVLLGAALYGRNWLGWPNVTAVTTNMQANRLRYSLAEWVNRQVDPAAFVVNTPGKANARGQDIDDGDGRPQSRPMVAVPTLNAISLKIKWGFTALFGLWAVALLPTLRKQEDLLRTWGWTLFAYLCLASVFFAPNYVVWPLALAALLPNTVMARAVVLLSCTALFNIIGRAAASALYYDVNFVPLLVFLPPLLYVSFQYLRGRALPHYRYLSGM